MAHTDPIDGTLRDRILAEPDVILSDPDVMRALVAANEKTMGNNVVDLRGIAMKRLENRLDRLEDTHRSVIAAAYENLAGTNQIHRAILRLLEPLDFVEFVAALDSDIAEILRVDQVRLVLETRQDESAAILSRLGPVLRVAEPGFIDRYVSTFDDPQARPVTLRQIRPQTEEVYGADAEWIRSEACLKLDFGPGRLPGLLALGSEDPHQFHASMGSDLLTFFSGIFERTMRRWLG